MLLMAETANTDLPLYRFLHRTSIRIQICWAGASVHYWVLGVWSIREVLWWCVLLEFTCKNASELYIVIKM
jgi:hypothetical protein